MDVLLTIAVPTYNRVEKLKFCLNRLLKEAQGRPVEIFVSDNASTDGTEEYMRAFSAIHPEVTYIRNSENVGADRNFLNCYECAAGEYVLLIGDDDVLLPGALDRMIQMLREKPVFVYCNSSGLKAEDPLTYSQPVHPEGEDRIYQSRDEMMREVGIYITFVSSLILRTELVREVPNKEQYIGTYFLQSHIALKTIAADGKYGFITKNCIAASGNTFVNYDLYYVWGEQYARLLWQTGNQAGLCPETIRAVHQSSMENEIYGFVRTLRTNSSGSKEWNKSAMLTQAQKYPSVYPRYLVAIYLPDSFLKGLAAGKNWVKKCLNHLTRR